MMSSPRITALINTHNYGRFVGEAIESVVGQDAAAGEMEVLVVDDGSTDDTAAQVAKFGERVRYIRKENGGQASALNVGFAEAQGEIIATLDGDDLWLPGKVRRVLEEFERHPEAGMVYHPMEHWDVQRNVVQKDMDFPAVSGNVPELPEGLLRYGDLSTSGMAFRKAALEKLLPVPERLKILADSYLGYLIIFVAPVAAVRDHLTRYRIHGGNRFSHGGEEKSRARRRWECWSAAVEEIKKWLAQHGWDLQRADIAAYVQRYELVAWRFRFDVEPPRRKEFFEYLRAHDALYGPLQRPGYRAFRLVMAGAALALGYNAFEGLRNVYRGAGAARMRETIAPAR
ncbi:MAG: glycosyltransferase family 2 protein [Acidobacteria bacterium]|nr:glycosyltransferase family 2 protein [Acidobacteriota bacterium]